MKCETYLTLEYVQKPSWPVAFEKSKIYQPNLEKLQFEGCKILAFLFDFKEKFLDAGIQDISMRIQIWRT